MPTRRFWIKLTGLTAAGLAVGSGGYWVQTKLADAAADAATAQRLQGELALVQNSQSETATTLGGLQQELTQARSDVLTLATQKADLVTALQAAQNQAIELQKQLDDARAQITAQDTRLTESQDLLKLYDQLDAIGLDDLAKTGLDVVAGGLAGTIGLMPGLQNGVQTARILLDDFLKSLPNMRAATQWLNDRFKELAENLNILERLLMALLNVAASTGIGALFGGFAKYLFGWLPSNITQKITATLNGLELLLTHTTKLTKESDKEVFIKVNPYLSEGSEGWTQRIVQPIREQALKPAETLLQSVREHHAAFETQLKTPVRNAIEQRASVRAQIAEYRKTHTF